MARLSNTQLEALKEQAAKSYRKGKFSESFHLYEEVLRNRQADSNALIGAAQCLSELGQIPQSIQYYLRAVEEYAASGLLFECIPLVKELLRLDPNHTGAPKQLAKFFAKKTGRAAQLIASGQNQPPPRITPPVQVPFLCDLSKNAFIQLLQALEIREVSKGTTIVEQGTSGDAMFIVASGKVGVYQVDTNGKTSTLATLSNGACFGEMALINDLKRMATVTALSKVSVLVISRKMTQELSNRYPSVKSTLHKLYRSRLLEHLMSASPLFSALETDAKRQLVQKFQIKRLPPRMRFLKQGQSPDGLHLVLDGRVEISIRQGTKRQIVATLGPGEFFGETALLSRNIPASANIKTLKKSTILRLTRKAFAEIASAFPAALDHLRALSEQYPKEKRPHPQERFYGSDSHRLTYY